MKKSIKKLWLAVLFVCMLVCMSLGFVACGDGEQGDTIEITEEAMRPAVVLGQEFDVLSVVENYDESLTYTITELYYLDEAFEVHTIPFEGTKFTLNDPYRVYAALTASKGDRVVGEAEFTLEYEIVTNSVTDAFMLAWNDMGVSKSLNANREYIYGDATHSIKAKYISSSHGKPCVGQFKKAAGMSVTDWENAVFKVDVYNPQEEDFILALNIVRGSNQDTSEYFTLKPKAFTNVEISLRRLGVSNNILADGGVINVRVGTAVEHTEYNYVLYLSNIDIVNYSQAQFPNLEWRTDDEILADNLAEVEALPGEKVDKQLTTYYIPNGLADVEYMAGTGTVSYKNYTGSDFTPPKNLRSESYLQYDIGNQKAQASGNYHGYAIAFNNAGAKTNKIMREELFNEFSVTDWSNAYVGFWVYNASNYTLNMYAQHELNFNTDPETKSAQTLQGGWRYVEFKLSDFGYTENPFSLSSYFLRIGFGFRGTGITTANTLNASFYIDGFDIYNKSGDDFVAETYVPDARAELEYMHAVGQVSVKSTEGSALTMPANFAGTSYLQYDITNESTLSSGNYHGYAIAMDSGKYPINKDLLDKFSVTDWSDAYVGFWVYNDSSYTLNMYGQHEANFSATGTESVTTEKGTWTYVEWKLTDFNASYTSNPFELEKYFLRIGFGFRGTGITTEGDLKATFYIAGFDIYDKTGNSDGGGQTPVGKTVNELLKDHYIPDGSVDGVEYMRATGSVECKTFTTLTKPSGYAGNDYLVYTIGNEQAMGTGNYHGYALTFNNAGANTKIPMTEELLSKLSVTDWSTAYVGFWVYNASDYTLNMYAQHELNFSTDPETKSAQTLQGGWRYVEFKLSDFLYTSNPFEQDSYFLRIGFGFRGTGITTANTLNASFYLTGFDIYNGSKAA